jgi:AraC-like DNA-binding protein
MKDAARHLDQVVAVVSGEANGGMDAVIENSWVRCAKALAIDPAARRSPRILTLSELRIARDAALNLIEVARPELDHLYKIVRPAKYVILLCDKSGLVIEHRGEQSEAETFIRWGTWLGGVWAEEAEGTNGIGTCVIEQRPLTVHQSQHFRARHIALSCSGAPIFDPNGGLLGVLDVSSIDPNLSEHAHALTGGLTIATAQAIEERLFRREFRPHWIVALAPPGEPGAAMLIAIDQDRTVVGADRTACTMLGRLGREMVVQSTQLWAIFEQNEGVFLHKDRGDSVAELKLRGAADAWPAIITPPLPIAARLSQFEKEELRLHPRLGALASAQRASPEPARGGLAPVKLRRIRDYVDSHLTQEIKLEALAGAAELSLYHFARSFKVSEGMTPHRFILERRLAKARDLLSRDSLSLAEIAAAVGFADQSHFTRRFREAVGVSPGQFRKL